MNDEIELVECDDCHEVKPVAEFRSPGHTAGGARNGFDVNVSSVSLDFDLSVTKELGMRKGGKLSSSVTAWQL